MKKTIIKGVLALTFAGAALSACGDFLTITPLNGVVVENYWEKKSEVESVITSCYYEMQNADFIRRVILWGELRGDNVTDNAELQKDNDLTYFYTNNITPSNPWTSWAPFYNVINLCNTVLHYAPQAQAKDGNYSMGELQTHQAEARAIRALCYFYLVRSFERLPLVTQATIGDDVDFKVDASGEDAVLDLIIGDLEWAERYIWDRSYFEEREEQKGRMNKQAVRALLADVHLWRGDYEQCAEYCRQIIDEKIADYDKLQQEMASGDFSGYTFEGDLRLYNGYPLLNSSYNPTMYYDYPYEMIFYTGNSFESIFEMQYNLEYRSNGNEGVTFFYGAHDNNNGRLDVATYMTTRTNGSLFDNMADKRLMTNTSYDGMNTSSAYVVYKFRGIPMISNGTVTHGLRSTAENWIVYRLTDVMLMRAEALAYMGGEENCREAFDLVTAVNSRACGGTSELQYDESQIKTLVLDERQRELMFEGKRWYDLVRMVRHSDNPTQTMSVLRNTYLLRRYKSNGNDAVARLGSLDNLFLPIYQNEIDVNPMLADDQNQAYVY